MNEPLHSILEAIPLEAQPALQTASISLVLAETGNLLLITLQGNHCPLQFAAQTHQAFHQALRGHVVIRHSKGKHYLRLNFPSKAYFSF